MKADQEVSKVALKRALATASPGETVPIESPVRASKNNGRMEGAVGIFERDNPEHPKTKYLTLLFSPL